MLGINMLVTALLETTGIDVEKAKALFDRINAEAPELLASIQTFVQTTNDRLGRIEEALVALLRESRGERNENSYDPGGFVTNGPVGAVGDPPKKPGVN